MIRRGEKMKGRKRKKKKEKPRGWGEEGGATFFSLCFSLCFSLSARIDLGVAEALGPRASGLSHCRAIVTVFQ